ncbi:MAG: site-specific DNA-methyltransferase [Caldilinea sp. CFX5]|nr:site-specific DNA-methyltransferase [Caldilinea sp. CFX5]
MPKKKLEATPLPLFELNIGNVLPVRNSEQPVQVQYKHPHGELWLGDALEWLQGIPDGTVDLIFADPPYNINKAEWDSFESQEAYIAWSLQWIREAARILRSAGSIYICGFSEILADLKHPAARYFHSCRWLVWHYRNKANLGKDWGRSHESILHFRKSADFGLRVDDVRIPYGRHTLKYPAHPQAATSNFGNGKPREEEWTPNPLGAKPKDVIEIPTTCNGMGEKTPHPTQKPEELVRKLILAASDTNQVVLDPFSGSGTTLVVAEQLGRRWLGCDLNAEYNEWAIHRLENVRRLSVAEWIEFDRKNAERRESIR